MADTLKGLALISTFIAVLATFAMWVGLWETTWRADESKHLQRSPWSDTMPPLIHGMAREWVSADLSDDKKGTKTHRFCLGRSNHDICGISLRKAAAQGPWS